MSDDGEYSILADVVADNSNTAIPHAYNSFSNGNYYNYYSATAESSSYTNDYAIISDSICPLGWKLPDNAITTHSWYNLFVTAYDLLKKIDETPTQGDGNSTASITLRKLPISLNYSFNYSWRLGWGWSSNPEGFYWSSAPYGAVNATASYLTYDTVRAQHNLRKANGITIRCIKK